MTLEKKISGRTKTYQKDGKSSNWFYKYVGLDSPEYWSFHSRMDSIDSSKLQKQLSFTSSEFGYPVRIRTREALPFRRHGIVLTTLDGM